MLASNHPGYEINLFKESLYFVNCRKEYAIRPLRGIPDSTNQIAALATKLNLVSNMNFPDIRTKLEYDAAIQSMKSITPPKRRNGSCLCYRILVVFGNRRRCSIN